jgi:integrase/recombinase XerC
MAISSEPAAPASSGWIEKYLEHVRVERRLAARTVELYAFHLQALTAHAAEANLPLDRVQTAHIRRWMAQLHSAGREPRGIALVLSCWRSFYRWLGNEGLIGFNPVQDVHAPKAGRPLPKALGVDDAVRLAELYDPEADPWTEARDSAIVEVLYGCGLRVSELTGLDAQASNTARGWVDLDALEANVLGKGSKRRIVPMGGKAAEAVRDWLAVRGDCAGLATARLHDANAAAALFISAKGLRMSSQAVWKLLRERSLKAGLVPRRCIRTCCAIRSPATCCSRAATCARCRSCWATPTSRPRRSTRGWISSTWPRPMTRRIRVRRRGLKWRAPRPSPKTTSKKRTRRKK